MIENHHVGAMRRYRGGKLFDFALADQCGGFGSNSRLDGPIGNLGSRAVRQVRQFIQRFLNTGGGIIPRSASRPFPFQAD